jgi:hypothetical protein
MCSGGVFSFFFSGKRMHACVFLTGRDRTGLSLHMQAEGFEEMLVVSTAFAELDPMWRRRGIQNMKWHVIAVFSTVMS